MATLSHEDSRAIARLFVRSQNLLKGEALDLFEVAVPNNRQQQAAKKTLKDRESGLRKLFFEALVNMGITEPLSPAELQELR